MDETGGLPSPARTIRVGLHTDAFYQKLEPGQEVAIVNDGGKSSWVSASPDGGAWVAEAAMKACEQRDALRGELTALRSAAREAAHMEQINSAAPSWDVLPPGWSDRWDRVFRRLRDVLGIEDEDRILDEIAEFGQLQDALDSRDAAIARAKAAEDDLRRLRSPGPTAGGVE